MKTIIKQLHILYLTSLLAGGCSDKSDQSIGHNLIKSKLARIGEITSSISGKYFLKLVRTEDDSKSHNWGYYHIVILDKNENTIFKQSDNYADWFSLKFAWDTNDRVWVQSGDVGTQLWELKNKTWIRSYCERKNGMDLPNVFVNE